MDLPLCPVDLKCPPLGWLPSQMGMCIWRGFINCQVLHICCYYHLRASLRRICLLGLSLSGVHQKSLVPCGCEWNATERLLLAADIRPTSYLLPNRWGFIKLKLQSRERHVTPQSGDTEVTACTKDPERKQKCQNERSFVTTYKKPAEFCCVGKSVPCAELSGVPQSRTVPSPHLFPALTTSRNRNWLGVPDINHACYQARKYAQWWRKREKNK